ncbi:MAG: hypothetical protein ABIJ09_05295 [Pseudomonadota bacterium]
MPKRYSLLTRAMAARCEHCPLCRFARSRPDNPVSKAVAFHGKFCLFWRAREKVYGQTAAQV